jgi:rubrerythrin
MALLSRVRRLIGTDDVVYECRQCGTTLESASDDCPNCGAEDTVQYRIE